MDTIDNINRLLKERGMSGAELSRSLGLSTAVYSQWNKRKTKPSNKTIKKIAEFFGVPVSDLTGEEQKEKPTPEGELDMDAVFALISKMSIADLLALNGRSAEEIARRVRHEETI